MHQFEVNFLTYILFVVGLIVGWLKGRRDFKVSTPSTSHNKQNTSVCSCNQYRAGSERWWNAGAKFCGDCGGRKPA
jgi:hypothetical protein